MQGQHLGQLPTRHSLAAGRAPTFSVGTRLLILVILLGAFALRLYDLDLQDIWWDEARNFDVALRPALQIPTAPELDIHPPLYFLSLHGWLRLLAIDESQSALMIAFAGRALSVWWGAISVALLFRLMVHFGTPAALLATWLAALSPFWLAESQETRMYTFVFALLILAAIALLKWTTGQASRLEQPRARWDLLGVFIVAAAASLLTHYNALFVVVSWFVWWGCWALLRRGDRWRQIRVMLSAGACISLLVAPVLPIAMRQIPGYSNPNLIRPTLWEYLLANWQAFWAGYVYSAPGLNSYVDYWFVALSLIGVAGAIGAVLLVRQQPGLWTPLTLLLLWLFGGLSLYYIAVLDRGAFNVRYSSFVTPAFYGLAGLAGSVWIGRIVPRWRATAAVVAVLVAALGMVPAALADLHDPRFFREDITGVTRWLKQKAGPQDVILVDQKYPFGFYYERYAIDAGEIAQGVEHAPARYFFVDINNADSQLTGLAASAQRVFWVQWFESDTDPRGTVRFLLDKYGRHMGEQWFQGYAVDWWELDPPTEFVLAPELHPAFVAFQPAVQVIAASLPGKDATAGGVAPVVLRWQRIPGGLIEGKLKARVALYNEGGERVAQADHRLLNDRHLQPEEWSEIDSPLNVYLLDLPADLAPGLYELRVVVYDEITLASLGAFDPEGAFMGPEGMLGHLQIREND
jgi:mannosyltransferase